MERAGRENFGSYIERVRKQKNATLEQLAGGLCSLSEITRIAKGERKPDKLLQDRLLSRLGVAADDYENFLDGTEYMRWKERQQLLYLIITRNITGAREALEEYRLKYDMDNRLERQFYLSMKISADLEEGISKDQLAEELYEAVKLTVPLKKGYKLKDTLLSVQEINLLLEYVRHQETAALENGMESLLEYIENSGCSSMSRAQIYPKAVYYFYNDRKRKGHLEDEQTWLRILKMSSYALESLRSEEKMYYLWEILDIRSSLLQKLIKVRTAQGETKKAEALETMLRKTKTWQEALEAAYDEYDIPRQMYEYCYLYTEKEVYCIGDVIRIRRNMLGMTRKELAENICSEKSLGRLERNQVKTQGSIVEELFTRLGLSSEYCRTELVSSNPKAIEILSQIRDCCSEKEHEKCDILLDQLEGQINMNIPFNRQTLFRYRVVGARGKGEISDMEYVQKMQEVLEITLPKQAVWGEGEKYFTKVERACLHNIAIALETGTKTAEDYTVFLYELAAGYEKENLVFSFMTMYEFIMMYVASYMGNVERYAFSDEISDKIMKYSLLSRRGRKVGECIYNNMWNEREQNKKIPLPDKESWEKGIQNCISLSDLFKHFKSRDFYERKAEIWAAESQYWYSGSRALSLRGDG